MAIDAGALVHIVVDYIIANRHKTLIAELATLSPLLLLLWFRRITRASTRVSLGAAQAQCRSFRREHGARLRRKVARCTRQRSSLCRPRGVDTVATSVNRDALYLRGRMFSTGLRSFRSWHGLIGASATDLTFQPIPALCLQQTFTIDRLPIYVFLLRAVSQSSSEMDRQSSSLIASIQVDIRSRKCRGNSEHVSRRVQSIW